MKKILLLSFLLLLGFSMNSQIPQLWADKAPVELGRVKWKRSLKDAVPTAKKENKPIFLLFQEVPGCFTCQNYGHKVLSHPLVVEAIETHFVPVAIFNNRGGQDAQTLKQFNEPSWNNPVVRIVSHEEKNLVNRLSGDYSIEGVVAHMIQALKKNGSKVPSYLTLLYEELMAKSDQTDKSVFAMYCFWSGEGAFGQMDGVVSTKPGFLHGHEVVEVEYNPKTLPYEKLVKQAKKNKMASRVFTRNSKQQKIASSIVGSSAQQSNNTVRPDNQPKYYLSHTPLKFLPMTELQASRVNSAIGHRGNFEQYLSPRQIALVKIIQKYPKAGWPNMIGKMDLTKSWDQIISIINRLGQS